MRYYQLSKQMFHSIAPLLWHNCAATDIRRAVIRPSFCSDTCGIAKTLSLVNIHPCPFVYTLPSLCSAAVFKPLYIHHEKLALPSIAKQTLKHHEVSHSSLFQPTVSFTFDRILILLLISHKNHRKPIHFSLKNFPEEFHIGGECFFFVISGHVFGPRCAQEIGLKIDDSRNYCN